MTLPDQEFATVRDAKTATLCDLIRSHAVAPIAKLLVVGCGDGREADVIARAFGAAAVGIDIERHSDFVGQADFAIMDAAKLALPDQHFDLVFSFHALEHMADPRAALAEMRRVVKPGGVFCVGTPNARRWVGYLGSPADWRTKLAWNWIDWKAMATGRFRNELGAHAGFGRADLLALCQAAFTTGTDATDAYYRRLYQHRARELAWLYRLGLADRLLPSVYVIGRVPG